MAALRSSGAVKSVLIAASPGDRAGSLLPHCERSSYPFGASIDAGNEFGLEVDTGIQGVYRA
jgi:hypothetical protein